MNMKRFKLYYSFISFLLCLSACFAFFFGYHNLQGGIWASVAALTVGFCCILHLLNLTSNLHLYFTSKALDYLSVLGFIICLVGSTFGLWYIFAMVYWKIPFYDYDKTLIFPCVFSAITGKWGYHLNTTCKQYSEMLSSAYSPLLQTI